VVFPHTFITEHNRPTARRSRLSILDAIACYGEHFTFKLKALLTYEFDIFMSRDEALSLCRWLRGTVGRTSVFDRRTFPVLYARPTADG